MSQPPRKSHQTQAHVDYRNSDAYQEELYQRAAATDSMERAHAKASLDSALNNTEAAYQKYNRSSKPRINTVAAADNTRVINARNSNSDSMRDESRDVRLTNNPGGAFVPRGPSAADEEPGRLSKALKKLPNKK